ncbi:hypothetical protein DFQ01_109155 [Paenibacillus cellulosilyticus]|uniref:Uncharacterized protein n=1 Tax=Paenibacillus cellulosilyticus TaxID=375489 RepID=A0A2V2YVN9_9BACL|nr:hypothetical protein [Paenibacillus cellulosilyticus]PWW02530.1 hypothetical protein DFQ01_109155 [Paenibacillus cellulosilyticus]QKS47227.1 hypothetical protein HUB94_22575 [Paenibacillus cellulosilyticus]
MKSTIIIAAAALTLCLAGCTNAKTNSSQNEQLTIQPPAADSINPPEKASILKPATDISQPNTDTTNQPSPSSQRLTQEITIYELESQVFDAKTTAIPSYHKGNIVYWSEAEVNSFNEGHSVTWGDALVRTFLSIANLIPYDYLQDETIGEQLSKIQGGAASKSFTLTTQNGVIFTSQPYDASTRTTVVDVDVPDLGTYKVISKTSADSGIQNIMKITFKANPTAAAKHSITILDLDDNWLETKSSKLPVYSNGGLARSSDEYPWTTNPLVQALRSTLNLVPGNETNLKTLEQELDAIKTTSVTLSNRMKLTLTSADPKYRPATVEVDVPNWGTYTISLAAAPDEQWLIPDKIVLHFD